MKKQVPLLLAACLLLLTACGPDKSPAASSGGEAASSLEPSPQTPPDASHGSGLTVSDARRLLAEDIDTDAYLILDGGTKLEVKGENYYVFIVANRDDNKVVGRLAVNQATGDKYNYEGEGMLGDYSEFSLYDPETDAVFDWDGVFSDGSRTIELLPADGNSFEYTIGEKTGVARVTGATAADEENELYFAWNADGALVLSGAEEGVFTPAEE